MSLMQYAKNKNVTIFIVGHVNKEGTLAGPKILEHMVDCVLYFEGESAGPFRCLRAAKNRFGSTNEIGVFEMSEHGLVEVANPSAAMLAGHPQGASGNCIACVMEGSIILMVDNSAAVMILPTTFFDFTQEANDFYFPPLVGTYLRVLRVTVFLISLLITPAWYLMVSSPGRLPSWLDFLSSPEPAALSLLSQLLVVEFLIDVLKLASLNTPDTLSNSFSMLGALILGDFAVQAGWLGPEVLVYMAFVSVASFAQPSYEMGYAFKLLRVVLLLITALFDVWGFVLGCLGILVLLATTKPLVGKGYLYPLIPFNGKALWRLIAREPISRDNT